jgi:hypothetical protein
MFLRQNYLKLLGGFVLVLLVTVTYFRRQMLSKEQARHYGCCTAEQIRQRTVTLYQALAPQVERMNVEIDHSGPGSAVHAWSATCSGPDEKFVTTFFWEANSGALLAIGCYDWPSSGTPTLPLNSSDAVRRSEALLSALGLTSENRVYRLAHKPEHGGPTWLVTWGGKEQTVQMRLDERNGNLTYLECFSRIFFHNGSALP